MALTVGLVRPIAQIQSASTPTVYNVSVVNANTEYSQLLSSNTKAFTIKIRDYGATLKIAFAMGDSGSNYITLPPGTGYTQEGLDYTGTIYFQATKANQVVEIITWS